MIGLEEQFDSKDIFSRDQKECLHTESCLEAGPSDSCTVGSSGADLIRADRWPSDSMSVQWKPVGRGRHKKRRPSPPPSFLFTPHLWDELLGITFTEEEREQINAVVIPRLPASRAVSRSPLRISLSGSGGSGAGSCGSSTGSNGSTGRSFGSTNASKSSSTIAAHAVVDERVKLLEKRQAKYLVDLECPEASQPKVSRPLLPGEKPDPLAQYRPPKPPHFPRINRKPREGKAPSKGKKKKKGEMDEEEQAVRKAHPPPIPRPATGYDARPAPRARLVSARRHRTFSARTTQAEKIEARTYSTMKVGVH